MALGFGFNKVKVLGSAEKFVQQGKLQNAIAEYEKVVKEDPKDLTVLNTIGDLCVRVGQNEKAAEYFKRVGDQYAQNGFTVKAIAIYKKLSKLAAPTHDSIVKLAELYTQQGLFNDARAQYMLVADQLLRGGDFDQAARIFQKILELEPENTATQAKLADLYIKLGKKEEALHIYFHAAETLYARNLFDAADDSLNRVLSIDPSNAGALLLRGMIAADSGDSASAIQYLEQVPNLDSRADALRALLRAKLQTGKSEGLEPLASKLYTVHNDISGISSLADWLLGRRQVDEALELYDQYADRLLSRNPAVLQETLYPLIGAIRNSPAGLVMMLRILQKAGDNSQTNEVMELLAHAYVQQGELVKARELYHELAELEPENPLHTQNYRQMQIKLGEDSVARPLSEEEASQALMAEELEVAGPIIHQTYSPTVEKALEAALTDAELFVSYNVPLKAIAPLEAALPLAPRDVNLHQRLASLYVKAERYADAARACMVLSEVYAQFGHDAEAVRCADIAERYGEMAASTPAPAAAITPALPPIRDFQASSIPAAAFTPDPPAPLVSEASTVHEFALDLPMPVEDDAPTAPTEPTISGFGFEISPETMRDSFAVEETEPAQAMQPPTAALHGRSNGAHLDHEIDLSGEWEDMISVEPETPPDRPGLEAAESPAAALRDEEPTPEPELSDEAMPRFEAPPPPRFEAPLRFEASAALTPPLAVTQKVSLPEPVPEPPAPPPGPNPSVIADKIQEIRFYISQGFWDIAQSAIEDLVAIAPDTPALENLIRAVATGRARTSGAPAHVAPPAPATPIDTPPVASIQATPSIQAVPSIQPAAAATASPIPLATPASVPPARKTVVTEPDPFEIPVLPAAAMPSVAVAQASATVARQATADTIPFEIEPLAPIAPRPSIVAAPTASPFPTPRQPRPEPDPVPFEIEAAPIAAMPVAAPISAPRQPMPEPDLIPLDIEPEAPAPAIRAIAPPPLPVSRQHQSVQNEVLDDALFDSALFDSDPLGIDVSPAPAVQPMAKTAPSTRREADPLPATRPFAIEQPVLEDLPVEVPDVLAPIVEMAPEFPPRKEIAAAMASPSQPRASQPTSSFSTSTQSTSTQSSAADSTEDILGDFVSDLERSLGDFLPTDTADVRPHEPEPEPIVAMTSPTAAAPSVPSPAASAVPAHVAASAAHSVAPSVIQPYRNGNSHEVDAGSLLNDILSELKEISDDDPPENEDPETHYNLGIAFKEMGLLDEAIGELQKVCHALEHGHDFSQPIQAYTWLAQCLVDKGVPEAAVRWYERALKLPGLDMSSRCSIYYDLGSAYELYGDRKAALNNFMEVYSSNIDFRDIASRIKVLKS